MVQPLNKNQWQLSANTGGMLIEGENTLQVAPLSSVSIAYGVTQSTTAFASTGLSSFYYDIYHYDLGASHELLHPFNRQPGLTVTTQINRFQIGDQSNVRHYPQVDINAYWLTPYREDFFYIGTSHWFDLENNTIKKQSRWMPSLHGGYTLQGNRYGINFELKYIAPHKNNRNNLIPYVGIENQGAFATNISLSRKFK